MQDLLQKYSRRWVCEALFIIGNIYNIITFLNLKTNNANTFAMQDSFSEFQTEFSELVKDDDYETITIEENEDVNNLIAKIETEKTYENEVSTASVVKLNSAENVEFAKIDEKLKLIITQAIYFNFIRKWFAIVVLID